MTAHYSVFQIGQRLTIEDHATNRIALLSPLETDRFQSMWMQLKCMKLAGMEEFYKTNMEKLCAVFVDREAA